MSDSRRAAMEALMIAGAGANRTSMDVAQAAIPQLPAGLNEGLHTVAQQIGMLRTIAQRQGDTVAENTQALLLNTAAQRTGGAALAAGSIASAAAKALGGGGGLVPLVSSIVGLFRRNRQEAPPALATYMPPEPIHFQGAAPQTAGMPIPAVDYRQDGLPRPITQLRGRAAGRPAEAWSDPAPMATPAYTPAVTVQVQTMDSRSFLDNSDQIARAVREAILNAHALGSVVGEL